MQVNEVTVNLYIQWIKYQLSIVLVVGASKGFIIGATKGFIAHRCRGFFPCVSACYVPKSRCTWLAIS